MSRKLPSAAALALLLSNLAAAAPARKPKPSYKVPAGWSESVDAHGVYLTDGIRQIFVRRVATSAAAKEAPEFYGGQTPMAQAVVSTSTVSVAGAASRRVTRRYGRRYGGQDSRAGTEYVYQELVLVPASKKDLLWAVEFQSPSAAPREIPRGLDAWKAFLKSFKPL